MQDFRSHVANQCRELNGRMGTIISAIITVSLIWATLESLLLTMQAVGCWNFSFPPNGSPSSRRLPSQAPYTTGISCVPMEECSRWRWTVSMIHACPLVPSCGRICTPGLLPFYLLIVEFPIQCSYWLWIWRRFGGGPACNRLRSCATCQQAQEAMDKRRKEELELFLQLQKDFQNETTSGSVCAIAMNWFRKWESFVRNRDAPLPGPVDNVPITFLRNGNRVLRPCTFLYCWYFSSK